MSDNIYKRVSSYVTELFEKHPNPNLTYHNLAHTKKVVERAEEIGAHYPLSEKDTLIIYIAAWFHDTGHLFTDVERHEEKSVELMKDYVSRESEITVEMTTDIANCISATNLPSNPKKLTEEIVCDADTYHFGTNEFKDTNKLIKKELELRGYNNLIKDWSNNTIQLLESHHFYTTYCKILLENKKMKNIEWLKRKMQKQDIDNRHHNLFDTRVEDKTKKQPSNLLARGLQTTMRLTSANHFRLSEMADRKANILISVNSIMISLILSLLADKIQKFPYLAAPVILFLAFLLVTIVIAISATRPKITEGVFSKEDVLNKKTNLLFFGNFYKSSLEEYQWAMSLLMKDTEYIYLALIKDIYQMGIVLSKKYKLIRLAYNIFMIGLIVSVITFLIAIALFSSPQGAAATIKDGIGSPL